MFTHTPHKSLRHTQALVTRIQQHRQSTMDKSRVQNSKVSSHIKFLFSQSRYSKLGKLSTLVANRRRVRRKTMNELSLDWQIAKSILITLENGKVLDPETEESLVNLLNKYPARYIGLAPIQKQLGRIARSRRAIHKSSTTQAA